MFACLYIIQGTFKYITQQLNDGSISTSSLMNTFFKIFLTVLPALCTKVIHNVVGEMINYETTETYAHNCNKLLRFRVTPLLVFCNMYSIITEVRGSCGI